MKIGIYGGSFNPIHNGHIAVAEAIRDEFELDCVLFMVAKDPPHKEIAEHVPAALRLSMTSLSVQGKAKLCASALELEREGKSYTIDTVREIKRIFAGAQVYCVIGADMLLDLPTWHEAQALMRETEFIAAGRGGIVADLEKQAEILNERFGAHCRLSTFSGPEISSTQIREAMREAMPVSQLVPFAAETFMYEQGLYFPQALKTMQRKLRTSIKPERYVHTMGAVRCAIELAARYGIDTKKARLAALLHDCAKFAPQEQCRLCEEYKLDVEALKAVSLSIIHGPLGAEVAKREYGVEDKEVLSAIYYHTLCKENMTKLEKIIYLADKTEPGRCYEGVEEIRAAARAGLDEGVLACMEQSIRFVREKGKKLHPGVIAARESILNARLNAQ